MGNRFFREDGLHSDLKRNLRKERDDLYGGTERNRCVQTGPKGRRGKKWINLVRGGLLLEGEIFVGV